MTTETPPDGFHPGSDLDVIALDPFLSPFLHPRKLSLRGIKACANQHFFEQSPNPWQDCLPQPGPPLMNQSKIKNIFWDVDGVLADLNYAYFHFLTGHPNFRDQYRDLKWEQLPEVLPILPEYGALELKTHPERGTEMDRDFCADQSYFRNRPLYPNVIEVLKELDALGYRQFTMSATFDVEAKMAYLNDILAPVTDFLTIECVLHGEFMHDTAKVDRLKECFQKYDLNPKETILVDDRIYNQHAAIESGAHPVRLRCEFTTDLPEELSWIPEFENVEAVKEWLAG